LLFVISTIDRLGMTLLIDPLKRDLKINDFQAGLLIGPAFSIFYAIAALPIAWLVDKGNRRALIIAGVLFWSGMTLASAWAQSFEILFAFRIGLAVGEAVLTPAAISLVGDLFPREERATPVGIFSGAATAGGSLAYIVTGALVQLTVSGAFAHLPIVGALSAWRTTLALTGIASAIGVSCLFLPKLSSEPVRRTQLLGKSAGPGASTLGVFGNRSDATRFYVSFFFACATVSMVTFSFYTWYPTYLVRTYGFTIPVAGYTVGLVYLIGATAGALALPFFIDANARRGRGALILTPLVSTPLGAIFGIASLLQHSASVSLALAALAIVCVQGSAILPNVGVSLTAGGNVQGRLSATGQMLNILVGLGVGPVVVGYLATYVFRGPGAIGPALMLTTIAGCALSVLGLLAAWPVYRRVSARAAST
jgi:MFS family permease